jgi:hypothetical protein
MGPGLPRRGGGCYITRKFGASISKNIYKDRTWVCRINAALPSTRRMLGNSANAAIIAQAKNPLTENTMSDETNIEREADGVADAIAVTAIIGVIVLTLCIWLQGMPS